MPTMRHKAIKVISLFFFFFFFCSDYLNHLDHFFDNVCSTILLLSTNYKQMAPPKIHYNWNNGFGVTIQTNLISQNWVWLDHVLCLHLYFLGEVKLTIYCNPPNTGVENLGIIFEFSPWVLKICPEDGLKVGCREFGCRWKLILSCTFYKSHQLSIKIRKCSL